MPSGLNAFVGDWQVQRRIEDRRAGQVITGAGAAGFHADGPGRLIYDEKLVLSIPGQAPMTGTRRYLWLAEDAHIQVQFADGVPFHAIRLDDRHSADRHHCAPDLYEGRYDFSRWPQWEAEWRVSGPRKDYVMITSFCR